MWVLISDLEHAGYEAAASCLAEDLDALLVHLKCPLRNGRKWRSADENVKGRGFEFSCFWGDGSVARAARAEGVPLGGASPRAAVNTGRAPACGRCLSSRVVSEVAWRVSRGRLLTDVGQFAAESSVIRVVRWPVVVTRRWTGSCVTLPARTS